MKISSNGVQLNVTDTGKGDVALVFAHHWGGSSGTWQGVIAQLAGQFRCIAIDARGAGASDAPATGYSAEDHATDIHNVINALGLTRYVLVGHSMGGKASQLLATRQPQGLAGLVLVAASPLAPMAIDDAMRTQMKAAYIDRGAVEWSLDNVLVGSPLKPEIREQLIADALRLSAPATAGWIEIGTREDFSARAARVNVPVAVVAGELDRVDPVAVVNAHIVPCYPGAEVHFLADKGHLLPVEAPDEVARIVGAFASAH